MSMFGHACSVVLSEADRLFGILLTTTTMCVRTHLLSSTLPAITHPNPALQKAVIELKIYEGIIVMISGKRVGEEWRKCLREDS